MKISDKSLLKTQAYVDGAWIDADSGGTQPVINPATGEAIIEIAKCGTAETRRAIEAADKALVSWRKKSAKERGSILRKWFNLMMEAQEDLAQIQEKEKSRKTLSGRPGPVDDSRTG